MLRAIGPQPHLVIYANANPVRDLLDRERSEEHLQSFNKSIETKKAKTAKRKETKAMKMKMKGMHGVWTRAPQRGALAETAEINHSSPHVKGNYNGCFFRGRFILSPHQVRGYPEFLHVRCFPINILLC